MRNPWFIAVQVITVAGQVVIINKGGAAFDTTPLSGTQWGWSVLFGILTIPLGALIRQITDRWVLKFFHGVRHVFMFLTTPVRILFGPCFRKLKVKKQRRRERKKRDGDSASQDSRDTHETEDDGHELSPMEQMMVQAGRAMIQPMIIQPAHLQVGDNGEDLDISPEQRAALAKAAKEQAAREAEAAAERIVDLEGLIETARAGGDTAPYKLEIHPGSYKKDPILAGKRADTKIPPSQDERIRRFMPRMTDDFRNASEAALARERRRKALAAHTPRPGQSKPRNGLSWEAFVRSKRR